MIHQRLLRGAACAGMARDRAFIHHNGEGKSRMNFRLFHQREGGVIAGRALPIPIDDDAIDPAADHVLHLPCNLRAAGGVISHIHVAFSSKPAHKMRVNFGVISRIEQ